MTKYLFGLFFLCCSLNVQAEQFLVNLLYNQCENLAAIDISSSVNLPEQQRHFELQSLAINNISDSLNYLRQFPLNTYTTEKLVNCQMQLSKIWERFLLSPSTNDFIHALTHSTVQKYKTLGQELQLSKSRMLPEDQLTKLRTMEAIFRSNLKSKVATLEVDKPVCYYKGQHRFGHEQQVSIARYLLNQPNQACRKAVWTRYYDRHYIKLALDEIKQIRQQQAKSQGYADYTHFILSANYLNTPDLVKQYLQGISPHSTTTPWDIGYQLKQIPMSPNRTKNKTGNKVLFNAIEQLKTYGIEYDLIDNQVVRLWYKRHLLGDINLIYQDNNNQAAEIIRYPVLGYQIGQARLFIKQELTSNTQKKQLIEQLSVVLSVFLKTSSNYLSNGLIHNNDHHLVAQNWLTELLIKQTLNNNSEIPLKNKVAQKYLKQLSVTRALLALTFYEKQSDISASVLANTANSRLPPFKEYNDYLSGFSGIVDLGPNYFAKLWQHDLASYLLNYATQNQKQMLFFKLFVVNEQNHSFEQNLETLFGDKLTPSELIEKVISAQKM